MKLFQTKFDNRLLIIVAKDRDNAFEKARVFIDRHYDGFKATRLVNQVYASKPAELIDCDSISITDPSITYGNVGGELDEERA